MTESQRLCLWLRTRADRSTVAGKQYHAAADEIERLRGVLAGLKARLFDFNRGIEMGNCDAELVATIDCVLRESTEHPAADISSPRSDPASTASEQAAAGVL